MPTGSPSSAGEWVDLDDEETRLLRSLHEVVGDARRPTALARAYRDREHAPRREQTRALEKRAVGGTEAHVVGVEVKDQQRTRTFLPDGVEGAIVRPNPASPPVGHRLLAESARVERQDEVHRNRAIERHLRQQEVGTGRRCSHDAVDAQSEEPVEALTHAALALGRKPRWSPARLIDAVSGLHNNHW
jgi:hypothetical protein